MDYLLEFIQSILGLGAVVILPIMIFILGVFFRMKIGAAIKSGLFVGIGFQGLVLVIGLLISSIAPVTNYYQSLGSGFTTTDLGFATVGAASWTVPFAPFAIPLIVFANLLLLKIGLTKVMNVDIWNYVHFLIPGAMAYALFNSITIGLAVTVGLSILTLFIAEKIAPKWQSYFGLEGTTCSTLSFISFTFPVAFLINKIIDYIPGLNKIDISMGKIANKLGFFGEPALVGFIVGIFLGCITKQNVGTSLVMGMGISAVLILIPRMVSIMMEGITPIGNAASLYMKKHTKNNSEIYIGMDIALSLGDPACITTTILTIPVVILFAFIIPGMTYFPIPILGVICYVVPLCVMSSNGNLFRSLITAFFSMFYIVYFSNMFAPEATLMMAATGMPVQGMVTDGFFGFDPGCVIIGFLFRIFG